MKTINHEIAEIALDRVTGTDFERFFQVFYPSIVGIEFVPLGGIHDGGADAFVGDRFFEGTSGRPGSFFQATIQADHRAKIRRTINRLREFGRDVKSLQYVSSRAINLIDREEEELSEELDVNVRIRDKKWIVGNINRSPETLAAFRTYLEPHLSFLREIGGATTVIGSDNLPARTLCVFLGQEIERRRGNTNLLLAVTDSLILWALEGTDPDAGRFMTRDEIRTKIEATLPAAKHFVRGVFNHRIELMAAKSNPTGREVRWHRKDDKFCLPFETRTIVMEENIEDESSKLQVLELYEYRAQKVLGTDGTLSPTQVANLAHRALLLTFEREGLELAEFLSGQQSTDHSLTIADQVDRAIAETRLVGVDAEYAKEIALFVLREAFYNSEEAERKYYGKLTRTYILMLTLRNEPKIVEYFQGMTSKFVLFVGSDIIVRALSERYLAEEDQMTVNMLRILKSAGADLLITHMAIEEVHAHLRTSDHEFENYFLELEQYVDEEIARHTDKILIRAYFYARINPLLDDSPNSWRTFIEQICSYDSLHMNARSREQVKNFLLEKFGFEYYDENDVQSVVDEDEARRLADQIVSVKSEDILARNDARHILAVYGKRRELKETHRPNPYGYRTWWLTHEKRVLQCTRGLVAKHGSQYIIRPEFILNFVALSPSTEAVRKSYDAVFPTLLSVRLSNRMREEVFHDVMDRAKELKKVDEARVKTMMSEMSNQLKGDHFKHYEAQLVGGPWAAGQ